MKLRRARYVELAKTRLEHIFVGAAINLARIGNWLIGVPLATTRKSSFFTLSPQPVFGQSFSSGVNLGGWVCLS